MINSASGSISNVTTWCIASEEDLQNALDWACGPGNVDCSPIQPSHPCFEPDNTLSNASFAFNSYYQQKWRYRCGLQFWGNGVKVDKDPSYDNCIYVTTRGVNKTATSNTTAFASSSSSSRRIRSNPGQCVRHIFFKAIKESLTWIWGGRNFLLNLAFCMVYDEML
ncbi:hypothetical protein F3Y22_tig00000340pilonHSYRG00334 [Hibiscus syriacus]|uniref:X8 domain-containing protein n=1 Tax=Hibiscus syriacus TaxID=106335 RepID=A0A6A3D489_HIBSY|nr:glucan endo-1,3-beta-glucosidase 13-like [Hibiscus syriacus]KAE8735404.1 hypothetical protein F3Y22_tig00000340pilonHSYRG00334 [Hibiscus syriacus]